MISKVKSRFFCLFVFLTVDDHTERRLCIEMLHFLKLCRLLSQNLQDLEEFQLQHVHGIVMGKALLVELEMVLYRC